ncbi:MAG TPA: hypothetical protein VFL98_01420 [Candidatus Paceibacterota bacterium]|nr:hypothetical protein [Candidatus Paceibacterota bacterium]
MEVPISMIIFGGAFALILALFILKLVEAVSGRTLAPNTRAMLDEKALVVERMGEKAAYAVEHLPSFTIAFALYLVHVCAFLVARSARGIERQAHRVAEFVSHKRTFSRRETKSDFLKQVRKHKETLVIPADAVAE